MVSGRKSCRKGHDYERALATLLRSVWPGAKRGVGQARAGGEVPDVDGTPFWLEAKRGKRISIRAAYDQAVEASDGRPPVVVSREDRSPALVTMGLEDWLRLVGGRAVITLLLALLWPLFAPAVVVGVVVLRWI